MFYCSKKTKNKVFHTRACFLRPAIHKANLSTFVTAEEAFAAGYHPCKRCDPLAALYHHPGADIMEYCARNGLAVHRHAQAIYITTQHSKWKIVLVDRPPYTALYHRNQRKFWNKHSNEVPGYHPQRVSCPTLQFYLEYIVRHENYRKQHPNSLTPQAQYTPHKGRKGAKRYRKEQARVKNKARKDAAHDVWRLLDAIQQKIPRNA